MFFLRGLHNVFSPVIPILFNARRGDVPGIWLPIGDSWSVSLLSSLYLHMLGCNQLLILLVYQYRCRSYNSKKDYCHSHIRAWRVTYYMMSKDIFVEEEKININWWLLSHLFTLFYLFARKKSRNSWNDSFLFFSRILFYFEKKIGRYWMDFDNSHIGIQRETVLQIH